MLLLWRSDVELAMVEEWMVLMTWMMMDDPDASDVTKWWIERCVAASRYPEKMMISAVELMVGLVNC